MKFLKEFGSMENLLANTDKLKGKMREKVEEHAEQGLMSKKLATIKCDCDVKFDAKDFELSQPDAEKVQEIFEELEFRRLRDQFIKLWSGEDTSTPTQVTGTATARAQASPQEPGSFLFLEGKQKKLKSAPAGKL
jgi:DNA polymerase I